MSAPASERGTGRTTELIRWASEEPDPGVSRYIVCHSKSEASRVFRESVRMEAYREIAHRINGPVTWDQMNLMHPRYRYEFAIDNLSLILPRLVPGELGPVTW